MKLYIIYLNNLMERCDIMHYSESEFLEIIENTESLMNFVFYKKKSKKSLQKSLKKLKKKVKTEGLNSVLYKEKVRL